MAKPKKIFVCTACGAQAPQWAGRCHDCGAWNTLHEEVSLPQQMVHAARLSGYAAAKSEITLMSEVHVEECERWPSGLLELDRVLGGGIVPGSVVLIGGDPGVGKSTLLLQTMTRLSATHRALYITGEESLQQVSMRARRLGLPDQHLLLLAETQVERVLALAEKEKPQVIVFDSIQTMYTDAVTSAPGSVSQVREAAAKLVRYAKSAGVALFFVGHVTKEGTLAGPRVLEHMVDSVLYFEGEAGGRYRVVRAVKNRFGAVNELGIFAMSETGLKEVANPSAIFLARDDKPIAGSSVMVTWEGSRPLLVEVQALVDDSHLSNPRRVTVGLEHNRLAMLLAVLRRHGDVVTYDQDVFVNVVGGVRVSETAADLAVVMAVVSSLKNQAMPHEWVMFGEVGLAGEIRPVQSGQERLREAAKHGFKSAIVPKANVPKQALAGIKVHSVERLQDALSLLLY